MPNPDDREQLNTMWQHLVAAEFLCRNCMHVTPDRAPQCRVCDKYDEIRNQRDTALAERDALKAEIKAFLTMRFDRDGLCTWLKQEVAELEDAVKEEK